ncbi:MAG: hypothetical protein K2M07_04655 [Muribaculaceae bacterium]|nr:hypothetical protein [Muribaculaceae bacterium]
MTTGSAPDAPAKKKKKLWRRILKTVLWFIITVLVIIVGLCSLAVWYLTPEKLTPLVEDAANGYLDAEVKVGRVELTFWHTFPKLTVDVDSLEIISRSLDGLPDSVLLPSDADSLLQLRHLHAGINLARLSLGEIALFDVEVESPKVNLITVNDSCANYLIVPPTPDDSTSTVIPSISMNRFTLTDAESLRYRNLTDSTDIAMKIRAVEFSGSEAPQYRLDIDMNSHSPLLEQFNLKELPVTLNGKIKWDKSHPYAVSLDEISLTADSLNLKASTEIEFEDSLKINSFKGEITDLSVNYILRRLPAESTKGLKGLRTDMNLNLSAELTKPYTPGDTTRLIPDMRCTIDIPDCHVDYHNMHWRRFSIKLTADVDGGNMDRTVINLDKFIINGHAMDVDLNGKATDLLRDPYIKARFKGKLNLGNLPPALVKRFANEFSGFFSADLNIESRKSYMQLNRFHKTRMDGSVSLKDFIFVSNDSSTRSYITDGRLEFGTNRKFTSDAAVIDSLLTLSLKIDSGSVKHETILLKIKDMKGGVGTRLTRNTGDRNQISGFGGTISFGTLRLTDRVDSLLVRITNVNCKAGLKRYKGEATVPELSLIFDADRLIGATPAMLAGIKNGHFDINAHIRKRRSQSHSGDTITRARRVHRTRVTDADDIDMEVDSGMKALLRRWDVKGSITADGGRLFSRAVPVKNRFRNIDLSFSTDSINLRDLDYTLGKSSFHVNGYIGNLRRSLTNSRRDNKIRIWLNVESDTLNINELSHLAFTDFSDSGTDFTTSVESNDIDNIGNGEHKADGTAKAFMVPGNIEAELMLKARHLLYTDIEFRDFTGEMLIMNKAINLRNLKANADIGSLDMSALYSTYDKNDIQFGMGLKINKFNLKKVLNLVPAIDTVMPMLNNFSGIIDADIAATSSIDSTMNFIIPTLKAAMKLSGDSLVLMDADTFKFLSKWLMFKNKQHNMIDHMSVEMVVEDNQLEIFPFIFDIDRYRLGVMGTNDLALNLNYHISVLKSPLPFKFGINISGNVDDMKIRLGGAKFKNNQSIERISIADTTRINLVHQIENIFRRSANSERLTINRKKVKVDNDTVAISSADSLLMIKEGFISAPNDSVNGKN